MQVASFKINYLLHKKSMSKNETKFISTRDFMNALGSGDTQCHMQNYLNGILLPDNRLMLEELSIAITRKSEAVTKCDDFSNRLMLEELSIAMAVAENNVLNAVNSINTFLSMSKKDLLKRVEENIYALGLDCPMVFVIDWLIFMDFNIN